MSHKAVAALVVLATLGAGVSACGEAEYEVPSLSLGELKPCGDLPIPGGYRCGSLRVPFERNDEGVGKTSVGFAVRPRDDRSKPSAGAIFAVEGGPGYSSTGTATAYEHLFGDLLDTRELVLVDQRGTGRSQPIECRDLQQGKGPELITFPECARRLGERTGSYRTEAIADDVDDVREALGYDRISLYGDSYGTFLAQSYAYQHRQHLDALVLDSAYPLAGESGWYPSIPRTGIRLMSLACERSDECEGDAGKRLQRLVDHLRDTGRDVGALMDAIAGAGSGPDAGHYFLDVDEAGQALMNGDPKPWRKLTEEGKPAYHHPRFYARPAEMAISCNDYSLLWDREASEAERREQLEQAIRDQEPEAFAPFTPREIALSSELAYLYCITWPQPTDAYEPPKPDDAKPPDVPTLVVAGEFDNITTPHEGRLVADEFPNSTYYTVPGAGHVSSLYDGHSPEARKIRRFIRANTE
jgi:pimeloyl-ACP methyl ester carboxylesterase